MRLGVFLAVCLLGVFGLYAVFGQLRFGEERTSYRAEFVNVTGLETNDFVRIAGVEVGKNKERKLSLLGTRVKLERLRAVAAGEA